MGAGCFYSSDADLISQDQSGGGASMKRGFVIPLTAAALCLGGRAEAQGQAPPTDPVGQTSASLRASTVITYDTNIARSNAATARQRGLEPVDENTRPAVDVDLLKAVGQQSLFLRGTAGYDFYSRNKNLDSERIDLTTGADLRAGPCQVAVSDEYARRQNNLDQVIDAPIAINLQALNTVSLSGGCTRAIGFTPTGSVSVASSTNSAALLTSTDYQSLSGQAGLAYQRPSFGRLSIYGQYQKVEYTNRTVPNDPALKDGFKMYGAGVRYERKIGARIEGSVDASYTSLSQNASGVSGFRGLTYGADLTAHVTGRLAAALHANRSTQPSLQLASSFTVQEDYSSELDYTISQRLSFNLGASKKTTNSQGAALLTPIALTRQETTDVYGGASVAFARRFSLLLDVRHETSNTNLINFNYSSMRVALTLSGRF
jgi:hypothetical protein